MIQKKLLIPLISLFSLATGVYLYFMITPQLPVPGTPVSEPAKQTNTSVSLGAIPLVDLEGNSGTLGEWTQDVLVVNFWAPWCVPCRGEVPTLIAVQKEYDGQVQVLGLVLDGAENATAYAAELEMNYPSFLAGTNVYMYNTAFGNKVGGLPFTAIIDRDRKIRYTHAGVISLSKLRDEIAKIL